jgi:CRISPR-associated endonuclease/helicase Cas3
MPREPNRPVARVVDGRVQWLDDHCRCVGDRAALLAAPFLAAPEARAAGFNHDIGKVKVQDYLYCRIAELDERLNHSGLGAWFARRAIPGDVGVVIAAAIAGHHAGMPDRHALPGICHEGGRDNGLLSNLPADLLSYVPPPRDFVDASHRELFARLLFSCLVDADRADAREFECRVRGIKLRQPQYEDLTRLADRLTAHAAALPVHGEVGRVRSAVLHNCIAAADGPAGLFQLTTPASVDRNLAEAVFAMRHAVRHGMNRVVIVCPTQSAMEQKVEALRGVLGAAVVVPSAFDTRARGVCAAVEDWDAPVVVTSLRDFIGVLFDNRPASCCRLHRIACATIVIDDAWRIPAPVAPVVSDMLTSLAAHFGSTVLVGSSVPLRLLKGARELGVTGAYERLQPLVRISWPSSPHAVASQLDGVADAAGKHADALVIVNSSRGLREFARVARGKWIYLSSAMCPRDRRAVLNAVCARKEAGRPVRLAADRIGETIDVTFTNVWREMADLPSVAAAAGRANRSGHGSPAELHVFLTEHRGRGIDVTAALLASAIPDLASASAWTSYANALADARGQVPWAEDLRRDRERMRFREIASKVMKLGSVGAAPRDLAVGEAGLVPVVAPAGKALAGRLEAAAYPERRLILRQMMSYVVWLDSETRDFYLRNRHARWVADAIVLLRDHAYNSLGVKPPRTRSPSRRESVDGWADVE